VSPSFNEGCRGTLPAANMGTIMSYCHLVPTVGINFNQGFGPQPTQRILDNVANQNCVYSCTNGCTENTISIEISHQLNRDLIWAYQGIQAPLFIDGLSAQTSTSMNKIIYDLCIEDDCYNFEFSDYDTVRIKDQNGLIIFSAVRDNLQPINLIDTWLCFPECTVGFTEKSNSITGTVFSNIATADFDQDGDLDIAVSGVTCSNFLSCAVTEIYQNDGNANFTKMNVNLDGIWLGDMAWGKMNNDNYLDLITIGGVNKGSATIYYYNPVSKSFDKQTANGVTASLKATLDLGDVNGDGYDDLIVGGSNPTNSFLPSPTKLYINNKSGGFTVLTNTDFPSFVEGDIKFANILGNSKMEIIISGGPSITNDAYTGVIYSDTGNSTLPEYKLTQELPLLSYSKLSLGHISSLSSSPQAILTGKPKGSNKCFMYYISDLSFPADTDGNGVPNYSGIALDSFWFNGSTGVQTRVADFDFLGEGNIFTTGESANPLRSDFSRVYFSFNQNGSIVFPCSDLRQSFLDAVNVGDYDGDNKIDLIIAGGKIVTSGGISGNIGNATTSVHINNYMGINNPPTAPLELFHSFSYNPDLVVDSLNDLVWGYGKDDHTITEMLKYNVRIGSAPGTDDILYPKAGEDGRLHLLTFGNSNGARKLDLNNLNLTVGKTYYAAVQTIDLSYAGSPWSKEISFVYGKENSTQVLAPKKTSGLKVYPNPSNGHISIKNLGQTNETVSIIDLSGKITIKLTVQPNGIAVIEQGKLRPGIYIALTEQGQKVRFTVL
jgi:hypothetical protein